MLLQTQQSANGSVLRTTSSTWTASGKPATATDANGNVTRFAYDLLERRIRTVDPMGRTTTYAYDAVSRPTKAFNLAVQATPLAQQTFTANGQRASLSDALGHTTTYAWDGFDRLSTTTWPDSSTETLAYDADGNVTSRSTRAGPAITYAYDPLNRPTGVSWTPAPAAAPPASGTLVTFGYAYNAVNQRVGETASDSSWLGYPAGSGTTAYTANNLNQYTAVGGVTPAYDNNGNLTSDGTATLTYDSENRLVGATSGGNTAAYAFDARGRRKLRTVNGTTTITVTGADDRALLDYDGTTGAVLRWYATGPGPNAVLGQMNVAAGTRDTLLPDTLGSVIASIDGSGTVTKFGYQPFGQTPSLPPQFGFTGQRPDQETGLYYYRARHYSPEWGRFTQPDPIGYQGGINLYAYVENDPLNALDASGNCPTCLVGAISSVALGYGIAAITGQRYSLANALTDAALGAVGAGVVSKAVQFQQLSGLGLSVGQRLTATGSLARAPTEGVYVLRSGGTSYVGQSGDLATRSVVSASERGLTSAPIVRIGELGGRTSREVLEQRLLNELGGKGAPGILNSVNPIGVARQGLLADPALGVISSIYAPGSSFGTSAAIGFGMGAFNIGGSSAEGAASGSAK